jgi:2-dehydropantoate 2-reductase
MNILVVGLGAIGSIYATKFQDAGYEVKVLVDENRYARYKKKGIYFNNKRYDFDYIKLDDSYDADLIIIAVKALNLDEIIDNISNFVNKNTVIISLLNGITSEEKLRRKYSNVIDSFYVGHASMRRGNRIEYDGIGKIVLEHDSRIEKELEKASITYEISKNIKQDMWQKFIINIGVNQTTAMLRSDYSCFRNKYAKDIAKGLMEEGVEIAKKLGISGYDKFIENTMKLIEDMPSDCKTSMYQDIENKRRTEVDIFAGEVCRLGRELGISTKKNEQAYKIIKYMEGSLD